MSFKAIIESHSELQQPVATILEAKTGAFPNALAIHAQELYTDTGLFYNSVASLVNLTGYTQRLIGDGSTERECKPKTDTAIPPVISDTWGDPKLYVPQTAKMLSNLYVTQVYYPDKIDGIPTADLSLMAENLRQINRRIIIMKNGMAELKTNTLIPSVTKKTSDYYQELTGELPYLAKIMERENAPTNPSQTHATSGTLVTGTTQPIDTRLFAPTDADNPDLAAFHQKNIDNNPAFAKPATYSIDLDVFHGKYSGQPATGKTVSAAWQALEVSAAETTRELVTDDFRVPEIAAGNSTYAVRIARTKALIDLISIERDRLTPKTLFTFENTYRTFLTTYNSTVATLTDKGPTLFIADDSYNPTPVIIGEDNTVEPWEQPDIDNPTIQVPVTGYPSVSYRTRLQVGAIYLQARGSDNKDHTSAGIHLRWAFRQHLERHLPKGSLYPARKTNNLLNHEEDYVRLFRTPYQRRVLTVCNPASLGISQKTITPEGIVWELKSPLVYDDGTELNRFNTVWIRFRHTELFDQIYNKSDFSPIQIINHYIQQYPIEIGVRGKLSFALQLENSGKGLILIEGIAVYEEHQQRQYILNCRKKIEINSGCEGQLQNLIAENIEYFRIKATSVETLSFETYQDFIEDRNYREWTDVVQANPSGNYGKGLHVQNPDQILTGAKRLEQMIKPESPWPQFNEGFVWDPKEYLKFWQAGTLRTLITDYLEKSKDDPNAEMILASSDPVTDQSTFPVSYTNLLMLAALDYHIARLLGLGITDFNIRSEPAGKDFIYVATYVDSIGSEQIFMALPTCQTDYRTPSAPTLADFTFGTGEEADKRLKIDPQGYLEEETNRLRMININRNPYRYETTVGDFFNTNEQWNLVEEEIIPVLYGVEYASDLKKGFDKPELPNQNLGRLKDIAPDTDFLRVKDISTSPHVSVEAPLLMAEIDRHIFLHQESQNGKHGYAIYGVNWFSCSSPVSARKDIETKFTKPIRPFPPVNLTAWHVVKENVAIMGTEREEIDFLDFLRLTFEWNPEHYQKYQYKKDQKTFYADKVNAFYRFESAFQVKGRILSVEYLTGVEDGFAQITSTQAYKIAVDGISQIPLTIETGDLKYLKRATLAVNGIQLEVVEVTPGTAPAFKVRLSEITVNYPDPDKPGALMGIRKFEKNIPVGKDFLLRENVTEDTALNNWKSWRNLSLNLPKSEPMIQNDVVISKDSNTLRLYFTISLNVDIWWSENIPRTGIQSAVAQWFGGTILLLDSDGKSTRVPIVQIQLNQTSVEIHGSYQGIELDPVRNIYNIQVYPGYRIYLPILEEIKTKFENTSGEVMFALQSEDSAIADLTSLLSKPVNFQMEYHREAVPPPTPKAPIFATRPDTFGKSTFTLELTYPKNNMPYGLMFYRANEQALLDVLYSENEIAEIRKQLAKLAESQPEKEEDFTVNRWNEWVQFIIGSGDFKGFTKFPDGYGFPTPAAALNKNSIDQDIIQKLRQAMENAFVPITVSPQIIDQFKSETGETTPSKPAGIISLDNDTNLIRFTDFLLDGASNNFYFYFAKETDLAYQWSNPSTPVGPIRLINSLPPESPQIRSVMSIPNNSFEGVGVQIAINAYPVWDHITQYRLFRTTEEALSLSPGLMEEVPNLEVISDESGESVYLTDRFYGLTTPPYGDPLYYCVVAYRELVNEDSDLEWIPSLPSKIVVSSVVDALNPEPPILTYKPENQNNGVDISVKLIWQPTVYKGQYLLYQMTSQGMWKLLGDDSGNYLSDEDGIFYRLTLPKKDEEGRELYHRFKVTVINASGLLNLREEILTL